MKLFDIGFIGNLKLNNRVIMAPMNVGGNNDSDGCLSQRGIDYFVERAKGGTGMIVTGAVRVTREFERDHKTIPLWMLFADHMIHAKWISELSERCHDYGTKVCLQLTPGGGRQAGAYAQTNNLAIGPSENPCYYPPYKDTRSLEKYEIEKIVFAFEKAARLIKESGADAIQLHGHEGYLLDQFTSPLWNRRNDEYGGSLKNRLRFSKELILAIKRGASDDFPVIYRYGLSHFIEGGRSIEEGLEMAKLLESFGVDALDIDAGVYENWYLPHPPTTIPCGSFAYLSEYVKSVVKIPVISSARIGYPEIAENILRKNQADFISLGRPLIADPFWCKKAKAREFNKIRPCLACHEGCLKRLMQYKYLSCAVNPTAGNEEYLHLNVSNKRKEILIVGGGISGMVAAITCAKRGHNVTLLERRSSLGGNFRLDLIPSFKNDYKRYIEYLIDELSNYNVIIHLNHFFEKKQLNEFKADVIINASGSTFKKLDIIGVKDDDIVSPFSLYPVKDYSSLNVAIIGGGLVGVEAALNVVLQGGQATIIEKYDELAKQSYRANKQHLIYLLKQNKIQTYLNTEVISSNGSALFCKDKDLNEFVVDYNSISFCVGMLPNSLEFEEMENVLTIGDADNVDNVMNAVWTAFRKSRLI